MKQDKKTHLCEKIKELRLAKNLSYKQLAELSGLDDATLRRFESSSNPFTPSLTSLKKLAKGLGCKETDLL